MKPAVCTQNVVIKAHVTLNQSYNTLEVRPTFCSIGQTSAVTGTTGPLRVRVRKVIWPGHQVQNGLKLKRYLHIKISW
jgi:hypothetical protein